MFHQMLLSCTFWESPIERGDRNAERILNSCTSKLRLCCKRREQQLQKQREQLKFSKSADAALLLETNKMFSDFLVSSLLASVCY